MAPKSKFDRSRRKEFHKAFAKELRISSTEAERKLWFHLRNKQFGRFKFRRQQPIGPFIADFFCSAANLVIELDGGQHSTEAELRYDERRSAWLTGKGYRVLRFTNAHIFKHVDAVFDGIWHALKAEP